MLKNNIFLTATTALYLKLSMTDAQRSHLGQRQFLTLISLLELRKFKVKVAYYYNHHDNHHHCGHHQWDHHQNYQITQNYQTYEKNQKLSKVSKISEFWVNVFKFCQRVPSY